MGVVDAAEHEPSMDPRILESEYDGGGSSLKSEMVAANWINYELKLTKFSVKKTFTFGRCRNTGFRNTETGI